MSINTFPRNKKMFHLTKKGKVVLDDQFHENRSELMLVMDYSCIKDYDDLTLEMEIKVTSYTHWACDKGYIRSAVPDNIAPRINKGGRPVNPNSKRQQMLAKKAASVVK